MDNKQCYQSERAPCVWLCLMFSAGQIPYSQADTPDPG